MRWWWCTRPRRGPRESSEQLQAQAEILGAKIDSAADRLLEAVSQLRAEVDRLAQIKREEGESDQSDREAPHD